MGNRAAARLLRAARPWWLRGVADAQHVRGEIWRIDVEALGRVYVGPYDELQRFLRRTGLSAGPDRYQAAHIVGGEHLEDIGSRIPYRRAPSVGVPKSVHDVWSSETTGLQTYWHGGRQTVTHERAAVTRGEVLELEREIYSAHPELRVISENIIRHEPLPEPAPSALGGAASDATAVGADIAAGAAETATRLRSFSWAAVGRRAVAALAEAAAFVALDLLVGHFERQLAEADREAMARRWKEKVGRQVAPMIVDVVSRLAADPSRRPPYRVYLNVPWRMVTEEMSQEPADMAVWGLKFLVGRPGFAEIFHDVEYDGNWRTTETRGRPYGAGDPEVLREFRRGGATYRVRGPFVTPILISDPDVWKAVDALQAGDGETRATWDRLAAELERLGPDAARAAAPAGRALAEHRYGAASTALRALPDALWRDYGMPSDPAAGLSSELARESATRAGILKLWRAALGAQQRALLEIFAPSR